MAGFVGYKKAAWQNANDTQRTILRWCMNKLNLGDPAEFEQPNGTRWFVFSDWRITLEDVARLGALVKGLAAFPNYTFPLDGDGNVDKQATKQDIVSYVQANWVDPNDVALFEFVDVTVPVRIQIQVEIFDYEGNPTGETVLVWRDHPTDTQIVQREQSLGDPLTLVAEAQGKVAWFSAAGSLPASWVPVGSD